MDFLLTLDWRTIISVLAFILSLSNSIWLYCVNRLKLHIVFKGVSIAKELEEKPLLANMAIENHSRLPISISRIVLYIDNVPFEFSWNTILIYNDKFTVDGKCVHNYNKRSVEIPLTISALGVVGGKFLIAPSNGMNEETLNSAKLKLQVFTNRGKKIFAIT